MTNDAFKMLVDDLRYLIRMRESMHSYITSQERDLWTLVVGKALRSRERARYARQKLGFCFAALMSRSIDWTEHDEEQDYLASLISDGD